MGGGLRGVKVSTGVGLGCLQRQGWRRCLPGLGWRKGLVRRAGRAVYRALAAVEDVSTWTKPGMVTGVEQEVFTGAGLVEVSTGVRLADDGW